MKHLKLFFALFAMLALGVGNAWGAEETFDWSSVATTQQNLTSANVYTEGSVTLTFAKASGSNWPAENKEGSIRMYSNTTLTISCASGNITKVVFTSTGSSYTAANLKYNGTALSGDEWTLSSPANEVLLTASANARFKKIVVTYETASGGGETPDPTTYTIKWHTAKGVTTDVTLNEGATITKPATDPTMTGYEFMGWTASCDVASDGSDFTALTDFGAADSDKDFYAVFAVATTTDGGGETATTGSVTMKYSGTTTSNMTDGNNAAAVNLDADEWSVIPTKGSASNMPGLNKAGDIRLYGHASGGNYLTITSKSYTITSAEITYTGTSYNNGEFYVNGVKTAAGNINSKEFVIKNANSGTTQVRIKTLVINYTSGSAGTTTYSDYITTCASDIEFVELGDDFKWSATEAEVTIDATDNVFPTLTNTHNVPVKYSSSDDAIASIASDGTVTLNKEGSVTITAKYEGGISAGTDKEYKAKSVDYTLTVKPAPLEPIAGGVIDILDNEWTELTTSDYKTVDAKTAANTGHSNAQYTAQCAGGNSSIQLRSNNSNSGIVSTVSGGLVKRVEIEWNDATSADRTLNIYGSNTPYTNPTDLYDTNKDGDKLGTIVKGTSTHLEISEDYRYIGLRSASGAMYLTKVTITWLPINSKVSIDDAIQHGSVSVTGATDLNAVAAGTVLTLDNTPDTGYKLAAYDVYKTDDNTTKVTVTDSKFIMPEHDVTISATFELAKTLTGIEITNAATQTTFWQGEAFNHDGLKVTAHFDGAADEDVTDKVTVAGSTDVAGSQTVTVSYAEGTTIKTTTYTINVKAIPNTKVTAYTVADAFDIIDKLGTASGVFISGIISQVDSYNSTYKSITYWISADGTTTNQLQAYSGKGLEGADFTAVTDVAKGAQVIVCGNLKKHNTTYEFDYNNYLAAYTAPTKAEPGIAYETTEYTANVNEAFTAPTLTNPNGLTVAYSTSDATLATVDAATGEVTIGNKAGKVTITASFAGSDDFVAADASYNITITDPSISTVTFDATIDITADAETLSLTKDVITMTFTGGAMNNGENYRCYKDQTLTISAIDASIQKIEFECTSSNPILGFADATGLDKTNSVWTGDAKSIELTASNKQVRMSKVNVYYKKDNRADAGLAWNPATISLTVGDAFTAPTFGNPNGLTVDFESDNTALATVTTLGVVSLNAGVSGKAVIKATYSGDDTYKATEVTCVITVNPKSEKVVILAEYNGQWYALKNAEQTAGKVIAALPVNYVGGKLYNVADADKATIEWQLAIDGSIATFKNGENYIFGTEGDTNLKLSTTECEWTLDGSTYKIGNRTFIYRAQANGFKNYNATTTPGTDDYSNLPVVTAPVYTTGDAYGRTVTTGEYGTICIPYGSSNYTGAEFYEISWMEMDGTTPKGIWLDQVNGALTAGKPYIFKATADEIAIVGNGTTAASPIAGVAGLVGTFALIQDSETSGDASNKLEGNYMISGNQFLLCPAGCWLNANRAYIDANIIANHTTKKAEIPGRRRVCLGETSENEATGFENIVAPEGQAVKAIVNGQLIIIRDGVKYNVQGQKL